MNKSIHILLPAGDLNLLKKVSRAQKKSVAELIRGAVRLVYGPIGPQKKLEAFRRLSKHDELHMEDWVQVKKQIQNRYE